MKIFTYKALPLLGATFVAVLLVFIVWAYSSGYFFAQEKPQLPAGTPKKEISSEPISPIPLSIPLDATKVALGERLFHDPRLSKTNTIACANCHVLTLGGTDGKSRSFGINGQQGVINAPTVFNSGLNFRQFWDGRAATLEDQIDGPLTNPIEMGTSWPESIAKLKQDVDYKLAFERIYRKEGICANSIRDAIATFERSLITPNGRFDKYLRGDKSAITADEKAGYRLFKDYGCASCHQGVNVGGNMYEKIGVMADYFKDRGGIVSADLGRFNVTGDAEHKHEFKVPSLRNVALTAPYLHDGSAATLERAIQIMGRYQLGVEIPAADTKLIALFLATLNGEYHGRPL